MQTNHQSKYQTIIKAPIDQVWEALTNADIVKQYFFGSNQETDWNFEARFYGLVNMRIQPMSIKE